MVTHKMSRKVTSKILDLVEEGALDIETVLKACLNYMSEDDVLEMAEMNNFIDELEDGDDDAEDEDDDDDDDDESDENKEVEF